MSADLKVTPPPQQDLTILPIETSLPPPIPLPRGTIQCGKTACAPLDTVLLAFAGLSAIGAIITGVEESYTACVFATLASAGFWTAHCAVRRTGCTSAAPIEQFNRAQLQFGGSVQAQANTAEKLRQNLADYKQVGQQFSVEREQWKAEREQLAKELAEMQQQLQGLRETNQELQVLDTQLQNQNHDLNQTNQTLLQQIQYFREQNKKFQQELEKIENTILPLQELSSKIPALTQSTNQTAVDLRLELSNTQQLVHKLLDILKANYARLASQLQSMIQENQSLKTTVSELSTQINLFKQALETASQKIKALTEVEGALTQQLQTSSAADVADREAEELRKTIEALQQARGAHESASKSPDTTDDKKDQS